MPQCYVTNCKNYYGKTRANGAISYHMIPSVPSLAARWARACTGKDGTPPRYMRVCSEHFSDECYRRDLQHELLGLPLRRKLKPDAVPDTNLGPHAVESPRNAKIPMRSSIRIAQRESLEMMDLGSPKVKRSKANLKRLERERLTRKIKYMRQLRLNFQQNDPHLRNKVFSPKNLEDRSLNKMHVMEDVREGCDEAQQPSSPGHADQRSETLQQPTDDTKEDDKFTKIVIEVPNKDDGQTEDEEAEGENKRKLDNASEESTPSKKARNEMHQEFTIRNKILTEFTEALDMNSFDTIQKKTEQIIGEIQTLNELAKEKEREWNSILHVKKLKEELLMRIQRQKQVYLLSNGLEISESEPAQYNNNGERKQRQKHELARSKSMIVRPVNNLSMLDANGHDAKYKQRPVRDVQSIIADYRQRHPESVPRRGRRIRSTINGQSVEVTSSKLSPGGIINFSSRALGSGSLVRQNFSPANQDSNSDIGMILSAMEANQQDGSTPSSTDSQDTTSFKEILVQFAKLSQSDKQELLQNTIKPPPPPYPEVTVHPVSTTTPPTNSLLHGILTKAQNKNDKSAFSPTLARLLTAPERSAAQQNGPHANVKASNVSISDILSTNKARNEITITPVGSEYESSPKRKSNTDEEEAEDSVDRLVIDEGGELVDRTDNSSDNGDEVPQCQGCNQKAAQFVCAGCGNQWYCSRECQVSAWDEHSEICSG